MRQTSCNHWLDESRCCCTATQDFVAFGIIAFKFEVPFAALSRTFAPFPRKKQIPLTYQLINPFFHPPQPPRRNHGFFQLHLAQTGGGGNEEGRGEQDRKCHQEFVAHGAGECLQHNPIHSRRRDIRQYVLVTRPGFWQGTFTEHIKQG